MNENVIKTEYQDKEIWIVKTAHISRTSVEDVRETVAEVQPDAICPFRREHFGLRVRLLVQPAVVHPHGVGAA